MSKQAVGLLTALFIAASACGGAKDAKDQPQPQAIITGANPADVAFMQGMIHHHAQALQMVALAPTRGASEKLLFLCKKIDISQKDEIKMMQYWLSDRGQTVPDSTAHQHEMMPGMLTPEQMKQLEAARGVEFERLFLTFMIQHHNGALTMVETLWAAPGAGQESDIFKFATDVGIDQRDEIGAMEALLNALPGS